jgi:hypothetical protein
VRSPEDALKLIVWLSSEMATLDKKRKEWLDLNAADRADYLRMFDIQFEQYERTRMHVLQDLVQFPPQHLQYRELLEQFNKEIMVPYRLRVFIMTKYPDGADAKLDAQLQTVINTVKDAVKATAYVPYLASDKAWHHNVWEMSSSTCLPVLAESPSSRIDSTLNSIRTSRWNGGGCAQ